MRLWGSKLEPDQPGEPQIVRYGLGFCNTLTLYGYSRIEAQRIAWATLSFANDITDKVLFGNAIMREEYLRHGGRVRDIFDAAPR